MADFICNTAGSPAVTIPASLNIGDRLIFNPSGTGANGVIMNFMLPVSGVYRVELTGGGGTIGNKGSRTVVSTWRGGYPAKIAGQAILKAEKQYSLMVGQGGTYNGINVGYDGASGASGGVTALYAPDGLIGIAAGGQGSNDYGYKGTAYNGIDAKVDDYERPGHSLGGKERWSAIKSSPAGVTYSRGSSVSIGGFGGGKATDDQRPDAAAYSTIAADNQNGQAGVSYFKNGSAGVELVTTAGTQQLTGGDGQCILTLMSLAKQVVFRTDGTFDVKEGKLHIGDGTEEVDFNTADGTFAVSPAMKTAINTGLA